jgi:putative addiction module component (TIGR02574 family)
MSPPTTISIPMMTAADADSGLGRSSQLKPKTLGRRPGVTLTPSRKGEALFSRASAAGSVGDVRLPTTARVGYIWTMASSVHLPPAGFDDLSVEEQLEYVEALWDRIAAHPVSVPVPDWHRRLIKERLEADSSSRPWADVRRDVEEKLGLTKG